MPFGTISSQTVDYTPRSPGIYSKSTVVFGQPANEFRIRPALSQSKDGNLRAAITRVLEKDVTVSGVTTRKAAIVTLTVTVPPADYTAAELDSLVLDISNFVATDTISRVLQGEA